MNTRGRAVTLSLAAVIGSCLGAAAATAQDVVKPATEADLQQKIQDERRKVEALRVVIESLEKQMQKVLHPTLEEANRAFAKVQAKINEIQAKLSALEASSPGRPKLEEELQVYRNQLDHFNLARSKLDPTVGLAADIATKKQLDNTRFAQNTTNALNEFKADLAEHEGRLSELLQKDARNHPGVVPDLDQMTYDAAGVTLAAAQLKRGQPTFDGPRPERSEEWAKMRVVGQSEAPETKLQIGSVVSVTLAPQSAPENPGEVTEKSSNAPADGKYAVKNKQKVDIATIVWTNQPDGTATMKMIFGTMVKAAMAKFGMTNEETFIAVESKQENAYIVGGADFQGFVERLIKAMLSEAQISDIHTNVRFVVRPDGRGVVLQLEGRVRVTGVEDGKQVTKSFPTKEYEGAVLIGTPVK